MARKILRNTRQLWVDTMGIYMLIGWLYIVTILWFRIIFDDRRRKYQKTIDHATDIQIQKICKNIQQWFQKKQRYGKIQKIFYYALTILSIGIFWWILHD